MSLYGMPGSKQNGMNACCVADLCAAPMEPGRFLRLSVEIAASLAELHQRNITHKDIRPHNIQVDPQTGRATISDPSTTSGPRYDYPATGTLRAIDGALPYMSPEQSGRMNRMVDHRTDLYSLGVIFYEMLTGTLPFQATDPLEWVHCHIARRPRPPADVIAGISQAVSDIVMKLLAKPAEERYQTARGLQLDLEKCLEQWEARRDIDPFDLGERDISDRLLIPEKLYGREKEIETLLSAFERVAERGIPELVMVAGYSGIGKTFLVRELYKPIVRARGIFISGRSDENKRDIPYSTISEAFKDLIQQILTESEERIAHWRHELRSALGDNGQVIVDVVPQVELIIGKQPAVAELPPTEAQNRFNMVFRQFIGVFATKDHPLVVFLDDLMWADSAGLKLLVQIITDPDRRYLLVVGAFRDNEVIPSHPLMLALDDIHMGQAIVQTIILAPLSQGHVSQLVAAALRSEGGRVKPLTELIYEKTAGNPLFVLQFLMTLYDESLLELDTIERRWKWDIARIQAKGFTDNVVDLLARKLRKLSFAAQQRLRLAACIGNKFDFHTLALISKAPVGEIRQALTEAFQQGLLVALTDSLCQFLHDRVQQAAYSLISNEQRAAIHLQIGRLFVERTPSESLEEGIFDIVKHFSLGASLISDQEERYRAADLNLIAGKKAGASRAKASALKYFSAGMAFLAQDSWAVRYRLTYDLYLHRAECERLNGNFDEAERLVCGVLRHAESPLDVATASCVKLYLHSSQGLPQRGIGTAMECLRLFGIQLSAHPPMEQVRKEYDQVWESIGDRRIEDVMDLPTATSTEKNRVYDIMVALGTLAFFPDMKLCLLAACRGVRLGLEMGNSDASAMSYVSVALVAQAFGDYPNGFRFGKLGYDLAEELGFACHKAKVALYFGAFINPWTRHLRTSLPIYKRTFDSAVEAGDLTSACYARINMVTLLTLKGDPLSDVYQELEKTLNFVNEAAFEDAHIAAVIQQRHILSLRGLTDYFFSFNNSRLDQDQFEAYLNGNMANRSIHACGYYIRKLQSRFIFGYYEEAIAAARKAKELLHTVAFLIEVSEYYYYYALALAAHYEKASPEEKSDYLAALSAHQKQLHTWAEICPENFFHKYALVSAEIARINGTDLEAMELYKQAIQSARAHGFVQNEGISYEVAARFHERRGFKRIAGAYLREARGCYVRWGADAKVGQLDQEYPRLLEQERAAFARGVGAQVGRLDAITVVKASQAISGEIVLSNLVETLMRIMLENAGAQKGLLILPHGDALSIDAQARVEGEAIVVVQETLPRLSPFLPISVINYVARTRESVILHNASDRNMFSSDPYILQNKPLSVLCLPLLRQADLIGLLYLENNLVTNAFTADGIAVLELLASQAAISLENATLYLELRGAEKKYREIFENAVEGFFQTTPEGRFIAANPALARMLGYDSPEELMETVHDIQHQIYVDPAQRSEYTRLMEDRASVAQFEFQVLRKDGSKAWVSLSARCVRDAEGQVLHYEGTLEDISERKSAEDALRASEDKYKKLYEEAKRAEDLYRSVLNSSADAIVIYDTEGRAKYLNPAFTSIFGWTMKELQGKRIPYVPESELKASMSIIRRILKYGSSQSGFATRRYTKDGRLLDMSVSTSRYHDHLGNPEGLLVILRDITAQKQAEARLRASEERYRTILWTIEDSYIETDTAGNMTFFNPSTCRMLGYSADELKGMNYRQLMTESTAKRVKRVFEKVYQTKQPVKLLEYEMIGKDGRKAYVEMSVSLIQDAKGNSIGFRGIGRDVSERKQLDERIRAVTQMTILSQERERGRISLDLHDQVAQDLSALRLACETVFDDSSQTDPDASQRITAISKGIQQVIRTVRHLSYDLRPAGLDKLGLVSTINHYCAEFSAKNNIPIELIHQGMEGLTLDFDTETNLFRVIQEALNNVKMHAGAGRITISLAGSPTAIILRITDDGRGFDVKNRSLAALAEKRMGLWTMEQRAGMLGGKMTIRSEPNQGTEVIVEVPYTNEIPRSNDRIFSDRLRPSDELVLFGANTRAVQISDSREEVSPQRHQDTKETRRAE